MHRILIVEDEPILKETYQLILSTQPYICEVASDGKAALAKCDEHTFDLILLDLMMPIMSGIEFLENYKHLHKMKSKIIVISNLSSGKELERARELGVHRNIVKADFSPKQLIAVINHELEASK